MFLQLMAHNFLLFLKKFVLRCMFNDMGNIFVGSTVSLTKCNALQKYNVLFFIIFTNIEFV